MVKVLFFIPNLAHGGAERVLTNLVNHMDYTKFDVTVQTMFDVGIYREQLSEKVKYIGGFPWYFRGNTKVYKLFSPEFLYRRYIKDKYDVIISYLEGPSARVIGGADPQQKTICWIHIQLDTEDYAGYSFRSMNEAQKIYNSYDRIVCVSDTVRQRFRNMFQVNVPVDVLYNTVETQLIQEKAQEKVEDIQFRSDEVNIISVGKLMKSKGYDRMVTMLKRLRNDGIPAHVYLVGKGEERENLEKMIEEQGIEDYWTFIGFRENPYKYVKNADLYVCSSRIEGFSTAVTESLIVGTPVVSTNCSGAKELLGYNNEYGIVTENNEDSLYAGIKTMLSTSGMLTAYKKKAIIRGSWFSTEKTVQAVEKMLMEVCRK